MRSSIGGWVENNRATPFAANGSTIQRLDEAASRILIGSFFTPAWLPERTSEGQRPPDELRPFVIRFKFAAADPVDHHSCDRGGYCHDEHHRQTHHCSGSRPRRRAPRRSAHLEAKDMAPATVAAMLMTRMSLSLTWAISCDRTPRSSLSSSHSIFPRSRPRSHYWGCVRSRTRSA